MSVQIAVFAPATRVASRKLGPTAGRRSRVLARRAPPPPGRRAGSRARAAGARRDAIRRSCVSASIAVGLRAEAREQAVQPLVEHAGGAAARGGQVPDGAVEQVGARVRDARGLGAGEGVSADEALVLAAGRRDGALGRAGIGDDGPLAPPARAPLRRSPRALPPARQRTPRPRPRRRRRGPPPAESIAPSASAARPTRESGS